MPATTIAEQLAAYAATLRYEDIPAEVVHRAKALIVDTIGCGIGGRVGEAPKIVLDLALEITSKSPATILGTDKQTSMEMAAFANDAMIRFLDYNDGYTSLTSGHPSDSIGALLVAAEAAHADGRALITATVAAYEIYCRLSDTAHLKQLGWDHAIPGGIASALGAARLLGLTQAQMVEAVNIFVSSNNVLFQVRIGNVSMWKGCAYAYADKNAIFAVQLAQRGMTGPSPIFEGKGGYFVGVSREPFALAPFGGRGGSFKIMECLMKRYPLGQYSQTIVDAALQLHARLGNIDDVAEVEILTLEPAITIMAGDPDKWHPVNRESADHSMPYVTAIALTYGKIDEHHFEPPYLTDKKLLGLVSRVKVIESEEANSRAPEAMLCDVNLTFKDGRRDTARVEYHRGHWRNPMSDEEVSTKFHELADAYLTQPRAKALADALWKLEDMQDTARIYEMARIGKA
ncbi:MAG TPA: MmgE/PrpD family protein [Burkholderiales bacterium]|jgi:2-methylcitrate dehydratase